MAVVKFDRVPAHDNEAFCPVAVNPEHVVAVEMSNAYARSVHLVMSVGESIEVRLDLVQDSGYWDHIKAFEAIVEQLNGVE